MALLRGGLHAHTNFSDGLLGPREMMEAYRERGFDFVAFTDHDDNLALGYEEAVRALMPGDGIVVIPGLEMTVLSLGGVHVGHLWGEREELYIYNHPSFPYVPPRRVMEVVHRLPPGMNVSAIEVCRAGILLPEFITPEIPLVKVASDDAHRLSDVGRAWVRVDARPDADSILRAIANGDVEIEVDEARQPAGVRVALSAGLRVGVGTLRYAARHWKEGHARPDACGEKQDRNGEGAPAAEGKRKGGVRA